MFEAPELTGELRQTLQQLEAMTRLESDIIATDVSYEDFLNTEYGDIHVEWAYGMVIKMPGVELTHVLLNSFIEILFHIYFEISGGDGLVLQDPALMRTSSHLPRRAPDIQVLLPENKGRYQRLETVGPADLVVEVVSKGTQRIDRVTKFQEYELGGVPEYWIIDPIYRETLFYQRTAEGIYERIPPDEAGYYTSRVLTGLRIPAALFWQEPLPGMRDLIRMVEEMLSER